MTSSVKHAAILAGGRSSRMGADKALLPVGGVSMLERIARTAAIICPTLLIIGRSSAPPNWPADLPATFLPDNAPDFSGPLAGLIRALEHATVPVLLLACDTPLLTAPTIAALLAAHDAAPATARATLSLSQNADGSIYAEPTFAVYTPTILPELREMLRTNRRSFQPLAKQKDIHTWPIPAELTGELLNVNDAESLAEANRILNARQ